MVDTNIERDFPHALRIFSPDRYEVAEPIRIFCVARFPEFRWPGRIAEITTARDGGDHRSPGYGKVVLSFPPKFFTVDCIGREDYGIVGENREGCFAKSFFSGKFSVSLFCSDE
jgi:hypothetical protein